MNRSLALILTVIGLTAALLPWLLTGCQPGALLPDDLRQEKAAYEERVQTAQAATTDAMRRVDSTVVVSVVRTLEPRGRQAGIPTSERAAPAAAPELDRSDVPPSAAALPAMAPTATTHLLAALTEAAPLSEAAAGDASRSPSPTGTGIAPAPPAGSIHLSATPTGVGLRPPTPMGMVAVQDVITSAMLVERLNADAKGQDITAIQVELTPQGFQARAKLILVKGIQQELRAAGSFYVQNDSLLARVDSIWLGEKDVTDQYKDDLQSRLASSLYHLLPRRYVQSVRMEAGQMSVESKARP